MNHFCVSSRKEREGNTASKLSKRLRPLLYLARLRGAGRRVFMQRQRGGANVKPLEGVKVVELARILAGPWAGQTLADLGADVVKVERPGSRRRHPRLGAAVPRRRERRAARRRLFPFLQSRQALGSRSISRSPRARRSSAGSPPESDVLIENFKTGGLAKYGLDYASLSAINPAPDLLLDHRLRPRRALCRTAPATISSSRAWAA